MRIIYVLMHTAGAILLTGIVTAATGATFHNALFDIGMWLQIIAMGAYAVLLVFFITVAICAWPRPQKW